MKFTIERLGKLLDEIKSDITAGDSFEGNLAYSAMEEGLRAGEFEVAAAWRVGNSQGQGGMSVVASSEQAAMPLSAFIEELAEGAAPKPINEGLARLRALNTPDLHINEAGGAYLRIDGLNESETMEMLSFVRSRSAFRDLTSPTRQCDHCHQPYQGPGLYCQHACAVADGGFHA